MKTADKGRNLIKSKEQLRLSAYLPTPRDVPTIGWGHTGKDVYLGLTITAEHAEELLGYDLSATEACINNAVKVPLTQDQLDALVCLVFNIGAGAFMRSHLLVAVNGGNAAAIAAQWISWDHQAGVELAGLKTRREQELALYNSPIQA
jgi:lysozyme